MPTYDYECSACEHRFEHFQKITDDPLAVCPRCKRKKLVRLFGTGAAVVFKGSGFYQTDYRSESYKRGANSDQAAGSDRAAEPGKPENNSGSGQAAPGGDSGAPVAPEAKGQRAGEGESKRKGKSRKGKQPGD